MQTLSSHCYPQHLPEQRAGPQPEPGDLKGREARCSNFQLTSLVAQPVKRPPTMRETGVFNPWVAKISWRRKWQPIPSILAWKIPLENPTDGGAWWTTPHGVAKSRTRLSDLTFTFLSTLLNTHSLLPISSFWRALGNAVGGG